MNTLKLYGTGSATANAVAQVIIPSKGKIRGIQASVLVDSITDNAQVQIEVSRASAKETQVNGAQQCVCEVGMAGNLATSGYSQFGINQFFPVNIDVIQGQIIYMHCQGSGTFTYFATFVISYE